ncbi:hypothetical protein AAG906_035510 [Vitis piasezkii]
MKKVGKVISKFFLFNTIPFNAVDSGPYYQSMIDTIAKAGPGIKGPTRYQIGNTYLEEEVQELETTDYIFSLMNKVVEKVGEENVVQVVTDNEASFKATDISSMKQIKETLDQAKMIIGFIYNSLKVFTKDKDPLRPE